MKDIEKAICDLIVNDATFKTLTGATASDKRLFYQYPPGDVDDSNPWVTYYILGGSLFGSDQIGDRQIPDRVLVLDIYGLDKDDVEDVFDRFVALLNKRTELNSTDHKIFYIGLDGDNDIPEIGPDNIITFHKNVRFRLKDVVETT